jgi:hypothetical protein
MVDSVRGGEPISVNGQLQTPSSTTQETLGGTPSLETPSIDNFPGGTASIGSTSTPSTTTTLRGTVSLAAAAGGSCLVIDLACTDLQSLRHYKRLYSNII